MNKWDDLGGGVPPIFWKHPHTFCWWGNVFFFPRRVSEKKTTIFFDGLVFFNDQVTNGKRNDFLFDKDEYRLERFLTKRRPWHFTATFIRRVKTGTQNWSRVSEEIILA